MASDTARTALAVEGTAFAGLVRKMPVSYPYLYATPQGPSWELNQVKGEVGERLMEQAVTDQFLGQTGGWVSCPPRSGPHGLDGLYLRAGERGQLRPPLVVEAKYGSSDLGITVDGRQMSEAWIRPRMAGPAQNYRTLAWTADDSVVKQSYVPEDVDAVPVPLSGSQKAMVWKGDSGKRHVYVPEGRSVGEARVQTHRAADMLSGAASGKIDYRARLFRYRTVDGEHEIILESLTQEGAVATGPGGGEVQRVIRGTGEELPDHIREGLQSAFQRALEQEGNIPRPAARRLAEHAVENPRFADRIGLTPRGDGYVNIIGSVMTGAGVAAAGGFAAGIVSAVQQAVRDGEVDLGEVGTNALVGASSATLAYASGAIIHHGLVSTEAGAQIADMMPISQIGGKSVEHLLGTIGGGTVGSIAFAVGMHLTDDYSQRRFRRLTGRSVARALAAKGAAVAATEGAATFGTASTGTAISSLSGASATKATLAWWGGGSVTSGGFGMAGGMVTLGGIALAAGTAVFAGVGYAFKRMDEAEQRTTVKARLDVVEERVAAGNQPEWE